MAIGPFLFSALVLLPVVSAHAPCNTVDDGYTCFPHVARNWGQYAPYFSLASQSQISPAVPEGCQITFVQSLSRHGARYPTSSKNKVYKALVQNIQANATAFDGEYTFLKNYTYSFSSDNLTAFGELEMYDSGVKFYNRYESLARFNVPFIRSSGSARVVASSQQFITGFQATKKNDRHANHAQVGPVINVILEETSSFNNSLDPDTCTNFENSEVGDDAQATFANIFVPAILKRVQTHLPGVTLNINEVIYLMDLCSFDTVAKTTDASQLSPFCNLFSHKEWVQYNYYQSLGKYYGYGGGNPLGPAQGIGFTNELIARLTRTPVHDHTSTNTTLDSQPSTFPLNATLYAEFSHDNGLTPIFFAMGLYNGTKLLSETEVESIEETDGYSAAWSVPFSARAYVEMMTCRGTKEPLVRVLVNDRVVPLRGCDVDHLGRCTREGFVRGLGFARDGGNWGSCFT